MTRSIALLKRLSDVDPVTFHDHWRNVHGPLARKHMTVIDSYVQAHPHRTQPSGLPTIEYDGVAEIWLKDPSVTVVDDPGYQEFVVPDEANFIDTGDLPFMLVEEEVLGGDLGTADRGVRLTQFVKRRDGVAVDDFRSAWRNEFESFAEVHGEALCQVAAVCTAENYEVGEPLFDATRDIWWRDEWGMLSAMETPEWKSRLDVSDVDPDATRYLLTTEHRIVWSK